MSAEVIGFIVGCFVATAVMLGLMLSRFRAVERRCAKLKHTVLRLDEHMHACVPVSDAIPSHRERGCDGRLDRVRELLRCETSRQLCSYEHNREGRTQCGCRTCVVYREESHD